MDFDDQDDDRRALQQQQRHRGSVLTFDQNEHVTSQGIFLQNELSVSGESARHSCGVRFDQVDFDVTDRFIADGNDTGALNFEDTSPMAGVVVNLTDRHSFCTTYSSAFETPTTTELNQPYLTLRRFQRGPRTANRENFEVGFRGQTRLEASATKSRCSRSTWMTS